MPKQGPSGQAPGNYESPLDNMLSIATVVHLLTELNDGVSEEEKIVAIFDNCYNT